MPTYIANPTDDGQEKREAAANDSAIPLSWFDAAQPVGVKKHIRAYDLQAQGDAGGSPSSAVSERAIRDRKIIGSHNDNPNRFPQIGRA